MALLCCILDDSYLYVSESRSSNVAYREESIAGLSGMLNTAMVYIPNVHLTTINISSQFLSADGYDRVDVEGSAFKNQIVGLLQAVGYLKG